MPTALLPRLAELFGVGADHILYGDRRVGGPKDVKTERIRTLLSHPEWKHLTSTEREGLALALRDVDVNDDQISLVLRVLYGTRKK